jgi:hypothetical protein
MVKMTESEQIDRDIDVSAAVDSEGGYGDSGKRRVSRIVWILTLMAIVLVVLLILPSGSSNSFNTEMSPEERSMRGLMFSIACDIHEYYDINGMLPQIPEDIDILSENVTYTIEDESSWFIMSGDSLIYYSDMDPVEFAEGEI